MTQINPGVIKRVGLWGRYFKQRSRSEGADTQCLEGCKAQGWSGSGKGPLGLADSGEAAQCCLPSLRTPVPSGGPILTQRLHLPGPSHPGLGLSQSHPLAALSNATDCVAYKQAGLITLKAGSLRSGCHHCQVRASSRSLLAVSLHGGKAGASGLGALS